MSNTIDDLMQSPYWIIDILPKRVPANSPGQFFAIEKYYLEEERLAAIKRQHINVILKLNCYRRISIDEGQSYNPHPELIAREMRRCPVYIMVDGAMILSEPDDTHMTVFNPDDELLELLMVLVPGEGLHLWKPVP